METKELNQLYRKWYDRHAGIIQQNSSPLLNKLRAESMAHFEQTGFPLPKSERYKYTNMNGVLSLPYSPVITLPESNVDLNQVFACAVPNLNTHLVLTLNGWFYSLKNSEPLPKGVVITGLRQAAKEFPVLVEKYYGKIAETREDGFASINTLFAQDGFLVYIPENVTIEKPIQIINILNSEINTFSQQRNLIIAGKNAAARIVVCDHTLSSVRFFSNMLTEIFIDEKASLDFYKIQNQHNGSSTVSNVFISQQQNSHLHTNTITLHGGLVRNNLKVKMEGRFCEANLYGMYLADKNQHVDNFTEVEHLYPDCTSNELYKGILDDTATGAFSGKILVYKNAQKTQAYQSNKNLLLTSEARMRTKPQLEIYADDVKCSHGAAVGQMDMEALFYLRSRGIGEKEARTMLMFAFCHEIVQQIRINELKLSIDHLVDQRLRGELSKCVNCYLDCKNC